MNNLKTRLTFVLFTFGAFNSMGQAIETSVYGGYELNGRVEYYDGEIDVKNGPLWGLTVGYDLGNDTQVQFIYSGSVVDTEAVEYGFAGGYDRFNTVIQHFHLGTERDLLMATDEIRPYGAISLGMTSYDPQTRNYRDALRFSMGLGVGVKLFPTEGVGLKFQGKLFMPLVFNGAGIYCSSGSGCGGGSSFYVPIMHGEFSGGVVFRLEK